MTTPDEILARINATETKKKNGNLKIFFGMCAGVGKTYSMLLHAKELMDAGYRVAIGYVETHGRSETEKLLTGFEIIPRKKINYKGMVAEEFDLEKTVELKPDFVLVDELAHSNIPGSKHSKRYQDVLELMEHGIHVLTTINVQHIESRSKTVEQITGINIKETVPDSIIEIAENIELIDLPIEELLQRLSDGKVYVADKAQLASNNFFKAGNLISLREMALRLTAEKVDSDLVNYMSEKNITGPWKAADKLMVAVGSSPFSIELIKWTRRMAYALKTKWYAVYVKTDIKETDLQIEQLEKNLRLAKELGAEVITTANTDLVDGLLVFALKNNISQIIIGKPTKYSILNYLKRDNYLDRLISESGNIDIYIIRPEQVDSKKVKHQSRKEQATSAKDYVFPLASVLTVSILCYPFTNYLGYQSVGLIQLLNLMLIPFYAGRRAIIFAAILNSLIWNFFFIPPLFTFEIGQLHDVLTLLLNFGIALTSGLLVSRVKKQRLLVLAREKTSLALLGFTKDLSSCSNKAEAIDVTIKHIYKHTSSNVVFFDRNMEQIKSSSDSIHFDNKELAIGRWALDNNRIAGKFTNNLPDAIAQYFPVNSKKSIIGLFCLILEKKLLIEEENLIVNFLEQLTSFYEKEEAEEQLKQISIDQETSRLYNTLIDSISHEFRTPIAVITGSSTSILDNNIAQNSELVKKFANEMFVASNRLNLLVENLLDISRLESGKLQLNTEPYSAQELILEVLNQLRDKSAGYSISTEFRAEIDTINADYGLMTQALFNIILNELTYTPEGSSISITTENAPGKLMISIRDNGHGLNSNELPRLFEKFYRPLGSKRGGCGLGLSIAKGFIEAHKGQISVRSNIPSGLIFEILLPLYEQQN